VHFPAFLIFPVRVLRFDDGDSCFSVITDNCLDHLCVLHILPKSIFCLSCHFLTSVSFVCTEPTDANIRSLNNGSANVHSQARKQASSSQQLNYWTSLLFTYRLSVKRFLHQHSGCFCGLHKVAKFPVHRHLRYQYPTLPKYYCSQGVNRCSLGKSYHFFGETCWPCRQGKVLLPLRCWYQVPARTVHLHLVTTSCCITEGRKRYIRDHQNLRSQDV
jgi:hypothetical protein